MLCKAVFLVWVGVVKLVHGFNNGPYRGDTGHAAGMLKM